MISAPYSTAVTTATGGATGPILAELYRQMLRIRMVEERIAELYPEQEMRCPVHLCIGQEAVAAGVCAALSPGDYVMSAHRGHGHYLAQGGDLNAMVAELYGKESGCCRGIGGSMHLIDLAAGFLGAVPIVGSTIPIAVGAAFGSAMRGEDRVTVVFFGDAATEEGAFHESMNFAAVHQLPVIFVCENNLYSVYSPLSVRQPAGRALFSLASAYGMESRSGDGNQVEAVYETTRAAVESARDGRGPVFMEFETYRWREHCGPNFDNDLDYRSEKEFLEWKLRCPIARCEKHLLQDGSLTRPELDAMASTISQEIDDAVAFARLSPFPDESRLSEHVYAD